MEVTRKKDDASSLFFFFFLFQAIAILTVSGGNSLLWSPETSTVKVNWLAIKCMRKSVNKGLINYSSRCLSIFLSLHLSSTSSSKLMHINPMQWSLNTSDLHCWKITIKFSKLWSYTFPHTRLHPKKPFFYSSLCSCLIDYLSFFISFHILFFWSWVRVSESECLVSVACGATLMLSLSGLSVCSRIDLWLRH